MKHIHQLLQAILQHSPAPKLDARVDAVKLEACLTLEEQDLLVELVMLVHHHRPLDEGYLLRAFRTLLSYLEKNNEEWCQLKCCQHKFHIDCIKNIQSCPLCRNNLIYEFN